MSKQNRKALAALKAMLPEPPKPPVKPPIIFWIIAHRLGKWKSHEFVAEACSRGLGYDKATAFARAIAEDHDEIEKRVNDAYGAMYTASGVDFDSPTLVADCAAVRERWEAELPAGMPRPD